MHLKINDVDLEVAKLYGMLPADDGESAAGRTAADNATVRSVFIVGPDKRIRLSLSYPMTTGRNFDEILRRTFGEIDSKTPYFRYVKSPAG